LLPINAKLDLAPDNRLQPALARLHRKLKRPEQVARIRHRHRRHIKLLTKLDDGLGLDRTLCQRIGRMRVQMDK